jgi:hypothetical protein
MTLCIAAECWHDETPCIAMCCDTRAERGGVFQELVGSEDVEKFRSIGPITALLSGDETSADELLTLCEGTIRSFAASTPIDESDIAITNFLSGLRQAAATRKKVLVDHHLDMVISMSFDDFVKRHRNEFSESHSRDIWNQVQHIDLGADIVLCGFSGDENVVVRLDRFGKTHWETNYSVVGVGSDIALAFLCQRDWYMENDDPSGPDAGKAGVEIKDALYRIVEAKWAAQKNRHVGETTAFEVLMPGGQRFDITQECYDTFKKVFKRRFTLKPFLFSKPFLVPDEDNKESGDDSNAVRARPTNAAIFLSQPTSPISVNAPHHGKFVGRRQTFDAMPDALVEHKKE